MHIFFFLLTDGLASQMALVSNYSWANEKIKKIATTENEKLKKDHAREHRERSVKQITCDQGWSKIPSVAKIPMFARSEKSAYVPLCTRVPRPLYRTANTVQG